MLLARFWNNRHGSIAPLLALTIVPLVGTAGAAIDYGRAKAAGITLYTVQVNTGGDATSTMLRDCASDKGKRPPSSLRRLHFVKHDAARLPSQLHVLP